ncbi:hypothetical protein MUK70_12250 [Dyadobacter chenwenxiniae]|uniref:Phosphatidylinositol glycan, class B n=1 Tax=Dyadobacter chenwenxiniae TaxID=2906456 RepID=A0A9X1TJG6_9BACT|nr:hypothetical protein [Dyadobacter chenwenxiniae]MCF0060013.1 hypothetical protein [Dyadobacter chenwenxiniae]UON85753.1 hypothetical protein MUK70_12250 [Dyadobacter chenwenxiniae]
MGPSLIAHLILNWRTTCCFLFIICCYISSSYLLVYCIHHDEHFQIIEFANFKRGMISNNHLPWEFNAALRPSLQPAIAYAMLNVMQSLRLTDPFHQAFIFRVFSSLIFLYSSLRLYKTFSNEITSPFLQKVFFFLSFFFYMFPISGVRFSSENMSACSFVLGFTIIFPLLFATGPETLDKKKLILTGAIFGISFLFRYQSAILIGGLASWLMVYQYRRFSDWLVVFAGFLIVCLLGVVLDYWLYAKWVFSAYNYLNFNIIESGSAAFGISPWHFYITSIDLRKWMIPLNISLIMLVLLFLLVRPKHPVSWVFYPFLLVHSLIAHKETRFVYPILIYLPFIVTSSLQFLSDRFQHQRFRFRPLIGLLMIINSFAFVATTVSVGDNSTEIFKFIRKLPDKPIKVYYTNSFFFYTLNNGSKNITPHFYKDRHVIDMELVSMSIGKNVHNVLVHPDTLTYIVLDKNQQEEFGDSLKLVFDPQPELVRTLNYRNWMRQGPSLWKLYELKPAKSATKSLAVHHEKCRPRKPIKQLIL